VSCFIFLVPHLLFRSAKAPSFKANRHEQRDPRSIAAIARSRTKYGPSHRELSGEKRSIQAGGKIRRITGHLEDQV